MEGSTQIPFCFQIDADWFQYLLSDTTTVSLGLVVFLTLCAMYCTYVFQKLWLQWMSPRL